MNWQNVATAAACVACFAAGFGLAHYRKEVELEEWKKSAAAELAENERSAHAKLVEALDALERARGESVDLRADLERVRVAADRRVLRASAAACSAERAAVARCEGLLREGVELLAEGGSLLQRNAQIHDAAVTVILK